MLHRLGPFQILEIIGRGGMGVVYRGLDPLIGRPVAIKVIRLVGYHDQEELDWLRDRLFREARAAGSLCHPGIVTIYQVGEEHDVAFIAMEFVDGPSLETILSEQKPKDKAAFCRILRETAAALDYAHHRGLIHRDIKPANIMLTASGLTKVTDFGIAKTMLGQTATKTGMVLGTPFYMSPEQIRGTTLDGRSDQFALAVVAYEIFTGRKPFQAEQLTSICYQIIHEEPLSPEDVNPSLGGDVGAVLKKGLAKEANARYATCTEFAEALEVAAMRSPKQTSGPAQLPGGPLLSSASCSTRATSPLNAPAVEASAKWRISYFLFALAVLALALPAIWIIKGSGPAAQLEEPVIGERAGAAIEVSPGTPNPIAIVKGASPSAKNAASKPSSPVKRVEKEEPDSKEEAKNVSIPLRKRSVKQGFVVWIGHVSTGGLLTISGGRASTGSTSGTFPDGPTLMEVYPAETALNGLTVFTSDPNFLNPKTMTVLSNTLTFVYDPRHATDIAIFEAPSGQNDWDRLVVSIRNTKLSGCVIRWHSY